MYPPSAERPSRDEAAAALTRVLGSRVFESAGRAREFLRFIVQETLAGRGDRLKGYSIAVEVFERPTDFDAQSDPLVRVEAGRLRRRLAEYYQDEGSEDAVRIELPRGGYTPVFVRQGAARTTEAEDPPARLPRQRTRWLIGAAALLAVCAVIAGAWAVASGQWSLRAPTAGTARPGAPASASGPRLVVLPLASLGEAAAQAFARGVTDETIKALVEFNIFATASPATQSLEPASLATLRQDFNAGYALSGTVRADDNRVRVTVRLTDTEFGTQLWTWQLDEDRNGSEFLSSQEVIGQSIAKIVSSPYGPVFDHEIERFARKPAIELDPYECLLRFYDYTRSFDGNEHREAVGCMERSVARVPKFAMGWSALAVLYLHEYVFGYDPQPGRGPPLDRALEAVRRSLDITGGGRVAAASLAGIQYTRGDDAAFAAAVDRALAITPGHPGMLAQIGMLLTVAGDLSRGLPLVKDAMPFAVHTPVWQYTALAFADLQTGQYEDALHWALKVDATDWFVAPLTAAASAALAGRQEVADRELKRLLALQPDFATKGQALLRRWRLNDQLRDALLEGLRRAGLQVS
jgi:adenylate cyclase